MPEKKTIKLLWVVLAGVCLSAVVLTILYGQGTLNLGALTGLPKAKVKRVAVEPSETRCPENAQQESKYCVFSLEPPLEYYVTKDGSDYIIYGPKVTEVLEVGGINLSEGSSYNGVAYSLVKKIPFTPIISTYRLRDQNGKSIPSFIFDAATAENMRGAKFAEIELPGSLKIRFNSIRIP